MAKSELHRILLVDDDLHDGFLTEVAIQKVRAKSSFIHIARYGNEAISYMIGEGAFADRKKYPFPTLVITDLKMSDGDGFDVLEFLQCNPEWSVVPRIMFSSSEDPDDVRTAYALGVSAYHCKPTDSGKFQDEIALLINYWASTQVPPVDVHGRLAITPTLGRLGARFRQKLGMRQMQRPKKKSG